MTALLQIQIPGALAPMLLGMLWRTSIDGILFALLIGGICRFAPRLPSAARFWLWWLVCAKLLMGLVLTAPPLPFANPLVLRLPAQHPAAAPAFFVARLAAQPTRLFGVGGTRHTLPKTPQPTASGTGTDFSEAAQKAAGLAPESLPSAPLASFSAATEYSGGAGTGSDLWRWLTQIAALLWASGFLLRIARIVSGFRATRQLEQALVPPSDTVSQEARDIARLVGLRRLPPVVVQRTASSPFLTGLLRPVVVLPDPERTPLTIPELRMALAHELIHLRRGDLWLALVPALAEAIFFFLPIARWAARECDSCREEVCDSAALALLGKNALADYGQLLLKVTLAAQAGGRTAPRMGMAVTATPAFLQMRRRLKSLRAAVVSPAGPRLRRAAALLVAVCLPGILPWHLRALPQSRAAQTNSAGDISADTPAYTVVDLGTLGGKVSDAYGVGEDGTVVGTANVFPLGGRGHAFLWRPAVAAVAAVAAGTGKMTDLCAGSVFRHSLAYSVNQSGQIAAAAFNNAQKPSAFLWTPGAGQRQRRYLGTLPGFHYSRATGINDEGIVVGAALETVTDRRGAAKMRAFVWQNGALRDLGTLGGAFSAATAVSSSGHIVGKADTFAAEGARGATHAALWEPGYLQAEDLGTLPGGANSAASAVNRQGEAVGYSESFEAPRHAFVYANHTITDLGALPASDPHALSISAAGGINDAGYIVGASSSLPAYSGAQKATDADSRAVLWLPAGSGSHRLVDLNRCVASGSGWTLESARAINNRGEIVGAGRIDGKRHAFLLKPISSTNL